MKRRQKSQLELNVESHFGPRECAVVDYANQIQDWMQPRYEALWTQDPTDALVVHKWMVDTLADAGDTFGLHCPTTIIVTAAAGYVEPDESLSPAYCALCEAARQRDEVSRILSRIAFEDRLWDDLLEPLNVENDICCSDIVADAILLILVGEYYGNTAETTWHVIETWHLEKFGRGPAVAKDDFLTLARIRQLPKRRS